VTVVSLAFQSCGNSYLAHPGEHKALGVKLQKDHLGMLETHPPFLFLVETRHKMIEGVLSFLGINVTQLLYNIFFST
jgi:hypothetical protein